MDIEQILRLMQNAGFRVHGADAQFIYIEDPACVLRAFATFAEYAWLAAVWVGDIHDSRCEKRHIHKPAKSNFNNGHRIGRGPYHKCNIW